MKKILFLLAASLFAFQFTSFASIDVSTNTGIIKIIPPGGGKPITVMPGQTIPTIADGSTIVVVTGTASVSTTDPSSVKLAAYGNTVEIPAGSKILVALNSNGAVQVADTTGNTTVQEFDGKIAYLKPGNTIVIAGNNLKNAEGYTPPITPGNDVNTGVQIEEGAKDISAVI